jgi:serine/threonine-protein kinase
MPVLPDPAAGALSFQVLAEISAGATARIDLCRVSDARRPELQGQLLAVKRLPPHIAEDPGFQAQFQDEVWMTSALTHPNVVVVKGWGTDSIGSYLAVELVQGVSLARLMKTVFDTGEVFTERMVVYVAARLCRGLAAAHALRAPNGELLHLVHRDLTPGNVLVSFTGDVKIADFGLAKAKQRLTKTLTGMSKGEPTYMAPEQARADEIDARADLFSLGVMLFELFAGRRPWLAKNDFDMVQLTARDPPADLRELRPKIDRELIAVVLKCLEKDPATRFQSASDIADRLENWLSVHGYMEDNEEALGRFVRRNAMRQMRWFERAIAGELAPKPKIGRQLPPRATPPPPAAPGRAPERPRIPGAPVPKAKLRTRAPTLDDSDDDDGDATDVTDAEWRIARQSQLGGAARIVAKDDGEGEGEEVPTLVQSGMAALDALRASAKRGAGRGLIEPPLITDEDSAERITAVKRTHDGMPMPRIANEESTSEELPTTPVRPRHGAPASRLPPPPQRPGAIPASPNVPQFPGAPGRPLPPPSYGPPAPYAPTGFGAAPTSPSYPPPKTEPPPRAGATTRLTTADDVQVIDRSAMSSAALTEESLIAEADRLAIEAVRRNEEARSAAQRAERRAAIAKLAADAAQIAADAVRLLATAGLAAAGQRLEQARGVERSISRAQADPAGTTLPLPDSSSGRHSSPPSSGLPTATPSRPSFQAPVFDGAAAGASLRPSFAQLPPPPSTPLAFPGATGASLRPDPQAQSGAFDDRAFRAKLKPGVLGMPPLAIAGLGIVAFCLVFLLIWLFFG